jgi:hypothetical protein
MMISNKTVCFLRYRVLIWGGISILTVILVACTGWPDNKSHIFRDAPYVELFSANPQYSIIITNKSEISALYKSFDYALLKRGPYIHKITLQACAAVGYPYFEDGRTNQFIIVLYPDRTVSHLATLNNNIVAPMRRYCDIVFLLCEKYGVDMGPTSKANINKAQAISPETKQGDQGVSPKNNK